MQNTPLASGKNESRFCGFLNVGAEDSLDILFRIFSDLLKLVYRYKAGLVGCVEIFKNFVQRNF